jgi:hypothetical protein
MDQRATFSPSFSLTQEQINFNFKQHVRDNMKLKLLILLASTFLFNTSVFSFGGGEESVDRSRSIPGVSGDLPVGPTRSPYGRIVRELQSLRQSSPGRVNCNTSLTTSAHALICNCANEAGIERMEGKTAVQRVVFSRAKSTAFPNSIRGVICQNRQFSWTINGFDSQCNRRVPRSAPHLNSPVVNEPVLSQCFTATVEAARLEFEENANGFYAMNYASTNHAAYRGYGNPMPSWVRNCINQGAPRVGSHVFCNAAAGYRNSVPPNGGSSVIVRLFEPIIKLISSNAFALVNETEIINTNSKHKVILDEKVKKLISQKYPGFSMHSFKSFSKPTRELMSGVRDNLPMAMRGDFDGNNIDDLILMGKNGEEQLALAFFFDEKNNIKSYVAHKFENGEIEKPVDIYLVRIPKTKIKFTKGKDRDAFQIEKFGGAAEAFLFNGTKFVRNNPTDGFLFNEQAPDK